MLAKSITPHTHKPLCSINKSHIKRQEFDRCDKVDKVHSINRMEKTGYVADHFVQRFSYLPEELQTKGRYTYFDNGGQQFVIDYATEEEQIEFNAGTGLEREWLGEGNHFSEPKE